MLLGKIIGRKTRAYVLLVIIICSVFEVVTVSALAKSFELLTSTAPLDVDVFFTSSLYVFKHIWLWTGAPDRYLLLFLGVIILTGQLIRIWMLKFTTEISQSIRHKLAPQILRNYLCQSYNSDDSSVEDLQRLTLAEVDTVVSNYLNPLINFIFSSIILVLMLVNIFIVSYTVTTFIGVTFLILILVYFKVFRNFFGSLGKKRALSNSQRYDSVLKSILAYREIKLYRLENKMVGEFLDFTRDYSTLNAKNLFFGQVPKYVIETIGVLTLVGVLLFKRSFPTPNTEFDWFVFGLIGFTAYRALPYLQSVLYFLSQREFSYSIRSQITDFLNIPVSDLHEVSGSSMEFTSVNVPSFSDPKRGVALKCGFEINPRDIIRVAGESGSGKTTLIDMILGLTHSVDSPVLIDSEVSTFENDSWKKSIAYAGNNPFISKGTLAQNLFFGQEIRELTKSDFDMLWAIGFINIVGEKDPIKLQSYQIEEFGKNLSNGQKQRVGIARALLRRPKLLVLDEATNGLDEHSESRVFEYLACKGYTVIFISHNEQLERFCEKMVRMEKIR